MCGLYGTNSLEFGEDWCKSVAKMIYHRGPDSQSILKVGEFYIGHNRLKIIDISDTSNQPIVDDNGNWMLFNGEIFNYIELYEEFNLNCTLSDTLVLFELLKLFGIKLLNKLNGFFSIVFFDGTDLFLIRDRFGEKPLYYAIDEGVISFASELRAFSSSDIDLDFVIKHYGSYVTVDSQETTFLSDVLSVQPGHYCSFNGGFITKNRWYHFSDTESLQFSSYNEFYAEFLSLFKDSIRIRLRTDVPMAISLSGGIDSTAIFCAIKRFFPEFNLTAVTYAHSSEATSELNLVQDLVRMTGGKLEVVNGNVSVSEQDLLLSMRAVEYPIWGASSVAFNDFYKQIKSLGFTVLMEGHGSDELFGGYPHFIEDLIMEYIRKAKIVQGKALYSMYSETLNESIGNSRSGFFKILLKSFFSSRDFRNEVNKAFDFDILPVVLRCFDRVTMYHSLETRSPFLDYRLVELVRRAPNDYVISIEGTKRPLRDFLRSCGLSEIANNKVKMGFSLDQTMLKFDINDWNLYVVNFFSKEYRSNGYE